MIIENLYIKKSNFYSLVILLNSVGLGGVLSPLIKVKWKTWIKLDEK